MADDVIERARQVIDDEVLTRIGRSVGDLASGHVARALADAGLLVTVEMAEEEVDAELLEIADKLDHEGSIAARPGQLDRLEQIASDLRRIARAPWIDPHPELG